MWESLATVLNSLLDLIAKGATLFGAYLKGRQDTLDAVNRKTLETQVTEEKKASECHLALEKKSREELLQALKGKGWLRSPDKP